MSESPFVPASPGSPQFSDDAARVREATMARARGAFGRYRIMAFVTGTMLLLLTFEMAMKYLMRGGESFLGAWVAILHGWIYVVYLITVFQLWSFMRWELGRMAALLAAGLVPVMTFVLEPRAKKWFEHDLPERAEMSVKLAAAMRGRGTDPVPGGS